jgi:AcrR family transcriptional regulator
MSQTESQAPAPLPDSSAALAHSTLTYRQLDPRKQAEILAAATEEFSVKGYTSASMNTLVRKAGISKGSLFKYFRTKQDLFLGLLDLATGEVQQWLRNVRQETRDQPLPQRLQRLLESGVEFIRLHPRLAKLYFQQLQTGDVPFSEEQLRTLHRRSRKFLAGILLEAAARGELRPGIDIARASFLVNSMFERFLQASYREHLNPGEDSETGGQALVSWVPDLVDMLCGGLCTPTPDSTSSRTKEHPHG